MENYILTFISVFLGACITWCVSWFYYKRAGDELNTTAKELKKEVQWIQKFIENSKANPTYKRNAEGEIEALTVDMKANLKATSALKAQLDKIEVGGVI